MVSFRGDSHKFYLKLKQNVINGIEPGELKELQEIQSIRAFYRSIHTSTSTSNLENIHYWILKEQKGTGIIPILITSLPWILFIFSNQIQDFFINNTGFLWLMFVMIYLSSITISVVIHYKERAWGTLHLRIIEDIIKKEKK